MQGANQRTRSPSPGDRNGKPDRELRQEQQALIDAIRGKYKGVTVDWIKDRPALDAKSKKGEDVTELREDAQAARLVYKTGNIVIVLDGRHDLTNNLKKWPDARPEYLRVEPQA
jgi:hypothetical protein